MIKKGYYGNEGLVLVWDFKGIFLCVPNLSFVKRKKFWSYRCYRKMRGLFPYIPILGVFIFYFFHKKGITGWGVQVLLWNLSWTAAFITTTKVSAYEKRCFDVYNCPWRSWYLCQSCSKEETLGNRLHQFQIISSHLGRRKLVK